MIVRSAKMADNWNAFGKNVLQSYWSSTVISRLVRKARKTNNIEERTRLWRPTATLQREDRVLIGLKRPFLCNEFPPQLKRECLLNRCLSMRNEKPIESSRTCLQKGRQLHFSGRPPSETTSAMVFSQTDFESKFMEPHPLVG